MVELDEFFGESSDVNVVTLVFRGEALSPDGLAQMDALLDDIVSNQGVVQLLAPVDPTIAPSLVIEAAGGLDATSITQAEIDSVRGVRSCVFTRVAGPGGRGPVVGRGGGGVELWSAAIGGVAS